MLLNRNIRKTATALVISSLKGLDHQVTSLSTPIISRLSQSCPFRRVSCFTHSPLLARSFSSLTSSTSDPTTSTLSQVSNIMSTTPLINGTDVVTSKRPRGRPPKSSLNTGDSVTNTVIDLTGASSSGSPTTKDRKSLANGAADLVAVLDAVEATTTKKRAGRPKGSTNKGKRESLKVNQDKMDDAEEEKGVVAKEVEEKTVQRATKKSTKRRSRESSDEDDDKVEDNDDDWEEVKERSPKRRRTTSSAQSLDAEEDSDESTSVTKKTTAKSKKMPTIKSVDASKYYAPGVELPPLTYDPSKGPDYNHNHKFDPNHPFSLLRSLETLNFLIPPAKPVKSGLLPPTPISKTSDILTRTEVFNGFHPMTKAMVKAIFARGDKNKRVYLSSYMRNLHPYAGLQRPMLDLAYEEGLANAGDCIKGTQKEIEMQIIQIVSELWSLDERECGYAALDLLKLYRQHVTAGTQIRLCELLIRAKPWWDSIDTIVNRVLSPLMLAFRQQYLHATSSPSSSSSSSTVIDECNKMFDYMDKWVNDDYMWTRRAAITHQLSFREYVDEERMFVYCLARCHEEEFFIRKAIGWALRQYAREEPGRVRAFCAANKKKLSDLSYNEAMKHL